MIPPIGDGEGEGHADGPPTCPPCPPCAPPPPSSSASFVIADQSLYNWQDITQEFKEASKGYQRKPPQVVSLKESL